MKITAIVPMRHNSERISGKNYRPFHGQPLYRHVVQTLLACPLLHEVVIDTDSDVILNDAATVFPDVRLRQRPAHLREGAVPMNDVLLHTVEHLDADLFLQTHSTNPLLRPETVTEAIERFCAQMPAYDSLFSVTRLQTRLWDGLARAINHNPAILLRTQDLPPVYEENSCLYLFGRTTLERRRNRIGERPLLFEMDPIEANDIDVELDFQIAEFLYARRMGAVLKP